MVLQLVWFKRDLRVQDHQPLQQALLRGPVLPLYIVEPDLWRQPDFSGRQWAFCRESLEHLREQLARLGQPLVVRSGDAVALLDQAHRRFGIEGLWSHEETGNDWTYSRDRRVANWAKTHGIRWTQLPQFGVIRGLRQRKGWAQRWESRMAEPLISAPDGLPAITGLSPGPLPIAPAKGLASDWCPNRQVGGRSEGLQELESFLTERAPAYASSLSSPVTAFRGCSRLSAYFSWGCLSLREVVQSSRHEQGRSIRSFENRLHWHCHFIQKLEAQPAIEFEDFHPFMRGLRCADDERLAAWAEGRTGVPFVDACMRALQSHGWINFRMRAMLMSFASYHLWLPWRDSGLHLARQFVDYEPGIHWSQCQMQSGSTAINTVRIYNPIKQGQDHDLNGEFVRTWVPELHLVPDVYVHEPWKLSMAAQRKADLRLGFDYPLPIVEPVVAAKEAKQRIWAIRERSGFSAIANEIQQRHGSRRSGLPSTGQRRRRSRRDPVSSDSLQLTLNLS